MRALFCLYITACSAICSHHRSSTNGSSLIPSNTTSQPFNYSRYLRPEYPNKRSINFENIKPPYYIAEWSQEQKNALSIMQQAYQKTLPHSPFIISITGKSGTGKTTLLKEIFEYIKIFRNDAELLDFYTVEKIEKWEKDQLVPENVRCSFIDNHPIPLWFFGQVSGSKFIVMTSPKKVTDLVLKLTEHEIQKLEQILCEVDLGEKSFRPILTPIEKQEPAESQESKEQEIKKKAAVKRLIRKMAPITINVFDELQEKQKNEDETHKELTTGDETPSYPFLFESVTKTIRKQDPAIKEILNATFAHLAYCKGNFNKPARILVHGPSGCGKTAIIHRIAEKIGWPFFNINASEITGAGYKGQNLEEKIFSVISDCENEKKDYNRVIIFFDEIDKLLGLSAGDKAPGAAINELLTFMEQGITVKQKKGFSEKTIHFSTKDCILLFSGAFNQIKLEDARRYFPEFFGRIFSEVGISKLKKEDFKEILLTSEESSYVDMKKRFEANGRTLTLEKGVDDYLAEYAFKRGTGTRALQEAMNKLLTPYFGEKAEEKNILVTLRECKELFDSYMKPDYPPHLYL